MILFIKQCCLDASRLAAAIDQIHESLPRIKQFYVTIFQEHNLKINALISSTEVIIFLVHNLKTNALISSTEVSLDEQCHQASSVHFSYNDTVPLYLRIHSPRGIVSFKCVLATYNSTSAR